MFLQFLQHLYKNTAVHSPMQKYVDAFVDACVDSFLLVQKLQNCQFHQRKGQAGCSKGAFTSLKGYLACPDVTELKGEGGGSLSEDNRVSLGNNSDVKVKQSESQF